MIEPPKLFISYSWTSAEHEAWVLQLATDLRESAVDVILDKWDLKEGHDPHAFMERMVTDPSVTKVALICDRKYVEKADGRTSGVGTEAQIISSEIYSTQDQQKFVALVRELDDRGQAVVPAYYKSRVYIDFSNETRFSESFEQLLRWLYSKPLHKKPELGKIPGFILGDVAAPLATTVYYRRASEALQNNRPHASAALAEYWSHFSSGLEKLRLDPKAEPFDDHVVKSVEDFQRSRNEAIELLALLVRYRSDDDFVAPLHRFLESVLRYCERPEHVNSWREYDFDNFRFIAHELFLYSVAVLLKNERFEATASLLRMEYYIPERSHQARDAMVSYDAFSCHMHSLDIRNQRLNLRRLSLHSDLLKNGSVGSGLEFRFLMQADFVLFLRASLSGKRWWPHTLLYVGGWPRAFELFARAKSTAYFARLCMALNVQTKAELDEFLRKVGAGQMHLPRWQFESIDAGALMGIDQLASGP